MTDIEPPAEHRPPLIDLKRLEGVLIGVQTRTELVTLWVADLVFEYLKRAFIVAAILAGAETLDNRWIRYFGAILLMLLGAWVSAKINEALTTMFGASPLKGLRLLTIAASLAASVIAAVALAFALAAVLSVAKAGP